MLPMVQITQFLGIISFISIVSSSGIDASKRSCFSPLDWAPCPGTPVVECASYRVPLDYTDPKVGVATLAVARFRSINTPRLGTVFVNPGGPGDSGVQFLKNLAEMSAILTNGQYDVVSWDPRGVNMTTPGITCGFSTSDDFLTFFSGSTLGDGIEVRGNFTDQDDLDNFFGQVNPTEELIVKFGQQCTEHNGAFLKYMGSTSVVRDMVALADCIEDSGKPINYYGLSYGSVIGNYFVNMFPERVGRVILDGVVDSIAWATQPTFDHFDSTLRDDELVVAGFAELCAQAGPQNCVFASNNSTSVSLLQEIRDLIDTAYTLHKSGQSNITSFDIRSFIRGTLGRPENWAAQLAPQLASWRTTLQNVSASPNSQHGPILSKVMTRSFDSDQVDPELQSMLTGITVTCLDSIDQTEVTTKRVFDEVVHVTQDITPLFGEITAGVQFGIVCHRFPIRAVERFTGPFNKKLLNPILVIGNRADPQTPFADARKIATALGNSARLLEQYGFGHESLAENSPCTQASIRNFLVNGTLPNIGQVCEIDDDLFPPPSNLSAS